MVDLSRIDFSQAEPSGQFEIIPEGQYTAVITRSEKKENKAGTGRYLQLTFKIIEGRHRNRRLLFRLNLAHQNEQVVRMAISQLAEICQAVGVPRPQDSFELHDIPLLIEVKHKPRRDTGEIISDIVAFRKCNDHNNASD